MQDVVSGVGLLSRGLMVSPPRGRAHENPCLPVAAEDSVPWMDRVWIYLFIH